MKYALALLLILICGCNKPNFCDIDIVQSSSAEIEQLKNEAKLAFDDAEKHIINNKPLPKPDIVGPNPDPAKCICKGTGIIVQGDDHKTPCPFHGIKSSSQSNISRLQK